MSAINHTGLTVASLERSLGFWRDGLGMETVMAQEKAGGYLEAIVREPGAHVRMVHLAFPGGGARIELFEYVQPAGRPSERRRPADIGFAHVCVACDDLDGLLPRLLEAGGESFGPVADVDSGANAGSRAVYVRDPDGHVLELFTPPPATPA